MTMHLYCGFHTLANNTQQVAPAMSTRLAGLHGMQPTTPGKLHQTGRPTWQAHTGCSQGCPLCRNALQSLAPVQLPALLVAAKEGRLAATSSLQGGSMGYRSHNKKSSAHCAFQQPKTKGSSLCQTMSYMKIALPRIV
jgi:hypothetical protein